MRNKTILIILAISQTVFAQEASFELSSTQSPVQIAWEAIEDSEGNYIISAGVGTEFGFGLNNRMWKLNTDGEIITQQDIEYEGFALKILFFTEYEDNYLSIGTALDTQNKSYMWIATLNNNLLIEKDTFIFMDNRKVGLMQCNEEASKEVVCTGIFEEPGVLGIPFGIRHNILTEETDIYNNLGVLDMINDIIVHPQDENIYLLNGWSTYQVDRYFNVLSEVPTPFDLNQQGDIYPFTDSTFLISGKYTEFTENGEQLIGIGISSAEFEEIRLDTFGKRGDTIDYPAFFQSIDFKTKDKIYCGGTSNVYTVGLPYGATPSWFVLAQYDSLLNRNWEQYYGGDAYYNMYGLIATQDGGCLMHGFRHDYQNNPGTLELYVLKVNADGQLVSTTTLPLYEDDFVVYPNPFNDQIHINFSDKIPTQNFQVELYDLQGKLLVATKSDDNSLIINTNTLAVGAYICVIKNQQGEVLGKRKLIKSR